MNTMKRISGLLLALTLVLALAVPAFAATAGNGTILISDSTDVDAGARSFTAYQILEVSLSSTNVPVYTVPAEMESFYRSYFSGNAAVTSATTAAELNLAVFNAIDALKSDKTAVEAFAEAALAAAITAPNTLYSITFNGNAATSVPYGYYVIKDNTTASETSRVSAVMLDTTTPEAAITIKADAPSIDKTIVEGNATTDYSNGAIGDVVTYKVTTKVPDMRGYTKYFFNINDTLSKGLDFQGITSITIDGTPLTQGVDASNPGDFYVIETPNTTTGETEIQIVFHDFIQYYRGAVDQTGKDIVVTYTAKIDTDAVIGVEGNPNAVQLIYSNDPRNEGKGIDIPDENDPKGVTPVTKTFTYTTGIDVLKYAMSGTEEISLEGAVFTLKGTDLLNVVGIKGDWFEMDDAGTYYKLLDGTYTTTEPTTTPVDTTGKYASTTQKYKLVTETRFEDVKTGGTYLATGTVDSTGHLYFDGLKAGTYTLTEITAPSGYNLLNDPIEIVIGWTAPADPDTSTECTWSFSVNGGTASTSLTEDGRCLVKVENKPSNELPSTGGMGTTLFTIGGLVLMAGAALVLVIRRKGAKSGNK